ncbi:hypothetical protein [Arthrobacter sp. H14]|uniref:hypothetical protein n=1 Tax=Arthrobacter sp. H14 TaxID=1312959 RepID=UPI000479B58B|nr:hypothetical protein [Arthrobacter sp. H14]
MAESGRLSQKQASALVALAVTANVPDAAKQAGIGERTLRRWLADDDRFAGAYREQSRSGAGQAVSALLSAQLQAVEVLRAGLTAGGAADRIRAASRLLEFGLKVRDLDIEERLAQLERKAETWQR